MRRTLTKQMHHIFAVMKSRPITSVISRTCNGLEFNSMGHAGSSRECHQCIRIVDTNHVCITCQSHTGDSFFSGAG